MRPVFPFSAIVGQDEMKLALLIAAVDPPIGGVLVFGDRGTGKSTAVRALAALLPKMRVVEGCRYHCDPGATGSDARTAAARRQGPRKSRSRPVPVVDLPLGATEDRVVGALDLERALSRASRRSSRACWRGRIAAFSTSTRSICSRITSSTCCSMSPPRARMSSSARG